MRTVHVLTVNGQEYLLPSPVTHLRQRILEAVQGGGGYVTIAAIGSGHGTELLVSPGMPVTWSSIQVDDDLPATPEDASVTTDFDLEF